MQIYHYDPVSKKYIGKSDAKIDPVEFSVNNKVVYLMPNCSTQAQPPETTSEQDAFFINGAWQIFERPPEPDDPEPTLEELKNTICNKITEFKKSILSSGILYEFGSAICTVNFNSADDTAFINRLLSMGSGVYIDKDGNSYTLTARQVKYFCNTIFDWLEQMELVETDHIKNINSIYADDSLTDIAKNGAIISYDFSVGWDYSYKQSDIKRKDEYDCLLNLRSKRLSKGSIQDQIKSLKIGRKL